jgi:hypothetical protein
MYKHRLLSGDCPSPVFVHVVVLCQSSDTKLASAVQLPMSTLSVELSEIKCSQKLLKQSVQDGFLKYVSPGEILCISQREKRNKKIRLNILFRLLLRAFSLTEAKPQM